MMNMSAKFTGEQVDLVTDEKFWLIRENLPAKKLPNSIPLSKLRKSFVEVVIRYGFISKVEFLY